MRMNIYQAIHGVMTEVGAIGKDKKNQQQGFMYRGVDDVMNALQPAFVHNYIFVVPEVLEQTREERTTAKGAQLLYSILKVKFTFYADDGTNVSATVVGEGMDSADKSSNKAMSVAFKYACFQVFCIPTEEMVDPDGESPPQSTRKPQSGVQSQQKPIQQAYDNSSRPTSEVKEIKTQRTLQLEYLINGTSHTLDEANDFAQKGYNAKSYEELTIQQFNNLYDRLQNRIEKEKSDGM